VRSAVGTTEAGNPPGSPVGVLIVDDHTGFRSAARGVVEATAGFALLGEASCGEEALELAAAVDPNLIILDVRMPGIGGVETARRLHALRPAAAIVLVSTEDYGKGPFRIASCGAAAFLRKEAFGPAALRALWDEHG